MEKISPWEAVKIDFLTSPVKIVSAVKWWESRTSRPSRAGISGETTSNLICMFGAPVGMESGIPIEPIDLLTASANLKLFVQGRRQSFFLSPEQILLITRTPTTDAGAPTSTQKPGRVLLFLLLSAMWTLISTTARSFLYLSLGIRIPPAIRAGISRCDARPTCPTDNHAMDSCITKYDELRMNCPII